MALSDFGIVCTPPVSTLRRERQRNRETERERERILLFLRASFLPTGMEVAQPVARRNFDGFGMYWDEIVLWGLCVA